MKFVTSDALRKAEAGAIAKDPALARSMMECAGRGLAQAIHQFSVQMGNPHASVCFLAGPGNNGGDAFVAALALREMGQAAEVWLAFPQEKLRSPAKEIFEDMHQRGILWREVVGERAWQRECETFGTSAILVDALLGTGASGEPRGDIRRAIEFLNERHSQALIVAVDIPTGLHAGSGEPSTSTVCADVTVTMGWPKVELAMPTAREFVGSVRVVPIGIPTEYTSFLPSAQSDLQLATAQEIRSLFPRRPRNSHKGNFGAALLLGGSVRYPGAIVLAAESASRSGVGLLRVSTVASAAAAIVVRVPEAIAEPALTTTPALDDATAILVGPGLGVGPDTAQLVEFLLREATAPLVLDADAISVLAGRPEAILACPQPVILTPHPGELARLLGCSVPTIQRDRIAAVRTATERTGAIVVLKGAGTLVAQSDSLLWLHLNGTPGMACGGSGDVLAGLLTGLLAQGLVPMSAANAAVWLHNMAGEAAALRHTPTAMRASDIIAELPTTFRLLAEESVTCLSRLKSKN